MNYLNELNKEFVKGKKMIKRGTFVKLTSPLPRCDVLCFEMDEEHDILMSSNDLAKIFEHSPVTVTKYLREYLFDHEGKYVFLASNNMRNKYMFSIYHAHHVQKRWKEFEDDFFEEIIRQVESALIQPPKASVHVNAEEDVVLVDDEYIPSRKRIDAPKVVSVSVPAPVPVHNVSSEPVMMELEKRFQLYTEKLDSKFNQVHELALQQHKETEQFKINVDKMTKDETKRILDVLCQRLHKEIDQMFQNL
jgi:hypothetical protein